MGSCVVFLVYGTILQQRCLLLKNSASIEKKALSMTVEESCNLLLSNRASGC